ncbi:hypothetical protein OIO90_005019 [Microbotryomycetes sp. JL221]|nr:hypothetical protein OIO90_005019 [Microbotryomycetes sp. JL221]
MATIAPIDNVEVALAESEHNRALAGEKKFHDKGSSSYEAEERSLEPGEPTEEEKATLPRQPGPLNAVSFLVAIIELAERFSYYGTTVVFQNFIQRGLPEGSRTGAVLNTLTQRPGALGMGQRAATGITTFNNFFIYLTPFLGAYIADTYLGRYKTIAWALLVAIIAHVIITCSAIPNLLVDNTKGALAVFLVGVIINGVGAGCFKSNISPLIADQYEDQKLEVKTKKDGTKVLIDPALTISKVFMYFYLCINVGALAGQIGMTYAAQRVGYWLAYLLPTIVFLLCPLVLLLGYNLYVKKPPTGSVVSTAFKVIRYAGQGKWTKPRELMAVGFWDRAKPSNVDPAQRPSWMTYSDTFVDEIRRGLKACKVFVFYPAWWLTYNQCNNNLVSQAAILNTGGLPNDFISNLDPIALVIFIPIADLLLYPALRRAGINFTPIKKITGGFLLGTLAMMCAAIVQHYAYKTNPCGYEAATCEADPPYSPFSVWVQTPSYVLIAFSEIFASITGLEYAYTKAPKSMRSLVTAVFLFTSAVSSALGEAFLPLSEDPLLVWNYGVMGVISFVFGIIFWFTFRNLDAEERQLNDLDAGIVGTEQVDNTKSVA